MNGNLRLTNGLTQYEGRVEIYWDSEWKCICNDGWDELDAVVVCRQLRYLATSVQINGTTIIFYISKHNIMCARIYGSIHVFIALSYDDHHFKSKRSPMLLANVGCNSFENNLTSCCSTVISNSFHCLSQSYAGVRCMQVENSCMIVSG